MGFLRTVIDIAQRKNDVVLKFSGYSAHEDKINI